METKASTIWEAALGELQIQVSKTNYQTWLKDTFGVSVNGDTFVVGVPNAFAAEWLEKRLKSLVKKTLMGILSKQVEVQFQVSSREENPPAATANGESLRQPTENRPCCPRLNPRYTFETFTVGDCNRLAHAAALSVADKPGKAYNPLFIYGSSGLGKTHLLHAIAHTAASRSTPFLYVSSEQFTNEFINSIRERSTEAFRAKYRSAELLLIDDIQFLCGKEQTQEGFFHTFNDLHNNGWQIVISSDRPPKAMPLLEERLSSRFAWGLIADIQPPDWETRMAILRTKADSLKTQVRPEVLELIAHRVQRNIRELEGALNRVAAYSQLIGSPVTTEVASKALEDIATKEESHSPVSPRQIVEKVARYFQLPPETLLGKRRDERTALARQVAMYLIREHTHAPLVEIGRELGGRDHTTVLHGYEKIAHNITADSQLRCQVSEIAQQFHAQQT